MDDESDESDERPEGATLVGESRRGPARTSKSLKTRSHRWTRLVHVYTSLVCFLVVLFFAVTGVTLNHPEWTFGLDPTRSTVSGTLPSEWKSASGVDWFRVTEYLRSTHNLKGAATGETANDQQASISFKGPGYGADTFIQMDTGRYVTTIESQGLVAVMNDLHKGRDTNRQWNWLIDVSGVFLALVSVTGLALQFFLRKRRRSGLTSAFVGALIVVVLMIVATR